MAVSKYRKTSRNACDTISGLKHFPPDIHRAVMATPSGCPMDSFKMPLSSLSVTATSAFSKSARMSSRSKSSASGSNTVISPAYWKAIRQPGGTPRESST